MRKISLYHLLVFLSLNLEMGGEVLESTRPGTVRQNLMPTFPLSVVWSGSPPLHTEGARVWDTVTSSRAAHMQPEFMAT